MNSVPANTLKRNWSNVSELGCVVFTNWYGLQFQGAGILRGIQEDHVDFRIYKNISVPPRGQGCVFFVKSLQLNNDDVKLIGFVQRHRDSEDRPGFVGAGCCSLGADPTSAQKAIATLLDLQDDVSGWATPNARENFYFERQAPGMSKSLQTLGTGYRAFEFDDSSGELDVPDALMALWYTAWIRPEEALFAVPSEVNGGKAQVLDRKLYQRIENEFEAEKKRHEVFPDTQIVSHTNESQPAKSQKTVARRPKPISLSDAELQDPKIIRSIVSEINNLKQKMYEKDREIDKLKESLNGIVDFLETRFRIKKNSSQSSTRAGYPLGHSRFSGLFSVVALLERRVKIGRNAYKLQHILSATITIIIIILLFFIIIFSIIYNGQTEKIMPPEEIFSAPLETDESQIRHTQYFCDINKLNLIFRSFNNTTDGPDVYSENIRRCVSSIDRSAIRGTDQCSAADINSKLDSLIQNIPSEESGAPLIQLRSEIIGGAENFEECFN